MQFKISNRASLQLCGCICPGPTTSMSVAACNRQSVQQINRICLHRQVEDNHLSRPAKYHIEPVQISRRTFSDLSCSHLQRIDFLWYLCQIHDVKLFILSF